MLKRTSSAYFSSLYITPLRINSLAQKKKIWAFLIYIVILICKKITTKQPNKKQRDLLFSCISFSQGWVQGLAQRLINENEWVNQWPQHGLGKPSAVAKQWSETLKFLMEQLAQPFQEVKVQIWELNWQCIFCSKWQKGVLGEDDVTSFGLGSFKY